MQQYNQEYYFVQFFSLICDLLSISDIVNLLSSSKRLLNARADIRKSKIIKHIIWVHNRKEMYAILESCFCKVTLKIKNITNSELIRFSDFHTVVVDNMRLIINCLGINALARCQKVKIRNPPKYISHGESYKIINYNRITRTGINFVSLASFRKLALCELDIYDNILIGLNCHRLSLVSCRNVTGSFLKTLNCKKLILHNIRIDDQYLDGLSLDELTISRCSSITLKGISSIKSLKKLHLMVDNVPVEQIPINCYHIGISDAIINNLTIASTSSVVVLSAWYISDEAIKMLLNCRLLVIIYCNNNYDDAIDFLRKNGKLEECIHKVYIDKIMEFQDIYEKYGVRKRDLLIDSIYEKI